MNYRVELTPQGSTSLRKIRRYISENLKNPIAAKNICGKIMKQIKDLKYHPYLFPLVDNERFNGEELRFFPVGNYIVYYSVDGQLKTVYILKIAAAAQSSENRLDGI